MTKQERRLWYCFLRDYPVKIYKQRIIENYIVDFYCSLAKIVIEIDGKHHYLEEEKTYDNERTYLFEQLGLNVIRFSNDDVDYDFNNVCIQIENAILNAMPSLSPPSPSRHSVTPLPKGEAR